MVNMSMEEGTVPTNMKLARVIPVYKTKDSQLFNNYHPISLLPCFSKILEKSNSLKCFEHKKYTVALCLDISKAFDTINQKILLNKLDFNQVRGMSLRWFASYLDNRKLFVEYNGTKSHVRTVTCGVPQGSVLGCLLYIIYTNDLLTN